MGDIEELDRGVPSDNTKSKTQDQTAVTNGKSKLMDEHSGDANRGHAGENMPPLSTEDSNSDVTGTFHPDSEHRLATTPAPTSKLSQKETVLSKQSSSASGFIAAIAIIGALIALGGVGYLWNEARMEKAKLAFENNSMQSDIDAQRSQISLLQASLETLQKALGETKADGNLLGGRIGAIEGQVAEMTGAHRVDWMLKETEHFIMVAERRLSLLADVDGALALLLEADQLIRDMAEPAARPLRQSVQEDLYALTQAADASVDTEGLFVQIALLKDQVAALKASSISYEMTPAEEQPTVDVPEFGFSRAWYETKQFLKSLVRVQRVTDGEIKPLLLQDQQAFVEQNIQLLLEQAQLALLRGDQAVFAASLKATKNRINSYLRTNISATESFLVSLDKLAETTIKPDVPSIEKSVRAVQVFRDFWQVEKVERQLNRAALESATTPDEANVEPVKIQPAPVNL